MTMNSSPVSPLRLGVIGSAGRGGTLAGLAHRSPEGGRVVACCDTNPEALAQNRKDFGPDILLTRDPAELLAADLDAVIVATPDFLHAEHALAVLSGGRHLFLEKPMAITIEDCDRILQAAESGAGRLYVGHNMRFFPVMRKMRELIDAGAIGRVEAIWCRHFISYGGDAYFKDWHAERRNTTGLLLQKGAHDIDIIHWLAGGHSRRVVGMGKLSVYSENPHRRPPAETAKPAWDRGNWPPARQTGLSPVIDVEDHSMVLLQLDNGVQASYQQCHYTPDDHRNYTVIGTEGRLENCGDHSHEDHLATIRLWNRRCGYQEEGLETFKIPSIQGTHGGADPLMIDDFLRFVRTGLRTGATPLDARMSVAAGCLATQSLRAGSIPFDVPAVALRQA